MSLHRYIEMQKQDFDLAFNEIKNGNKQSHWIWYIFPQLRGLGSSYMDATFSFESILEAQEFVKNEYLYNNLIKITTALYEVKDKTIMEIVGYPDCLKINSCMTLFSHISSNAIFKKVLDKYYSGNECEFTLEKLKSLNL